MGHGFPFQWTRRPDLGSVLNVPIAASSKIIAHAVHLLNRTIDNIDSCILCQILLAWGERGILAKYVAANQLDSPFVNALLDGLWNGTQFRLIRPT